MSPRLSLFRSGKNDAAPAEANERDRQAARFGRRKSGLITPLKRDHDGPTDNEVADAKRVLRQRLGRELTHVEAELCRLLGHAPSRKERRDNAAMVRRALGQRGRRGRPEVLAARGALMPEARRRLLATARERRDLRLGQ